MNRRLFLGMSSAAAASTALVMTSDIEPKPQRSQSPSMSDAAMKARAQRRPKVTMNGVTVYDINTDSMVEISAASFAAMEASSQRRRDGI